MKLFPDISKADGQVIRALVEKMGIKLPPVVFGLHVVIASTDPVDTCEITIGLSQAQMIAALEALARVPELVDQQRDSLAQMAREARDPQLPYPRAGAAGGEGGSPPA